LKTAVIAAALLIPLQIFVGDMHGLNTLKHQPQKIAAMEAIWETESGVPLVLFGIPDAETKTNKYAIEIPNAASLILTHHAEGEIKGLNEFEGAHPPVIPLFFGFRIMVGLGMLMLLVSWWGCWQIIAMRRGRRQEFSPLLLKVFVGMTFSGWVAVLAGWYVTEIGRQPWLVTGVLKTADAVTTTPASNVGMSLTIYLSLYVVLLSAYIWTLFLMARKSALLDRPEDLSILQENLVQKNL
jgi:cytochrome d ubiquinol oxidase subunit I